MGKFVTLVLEPRFNDEYGEYANLPVFNAHGDVVGYTGGEVPETGNPCEFHVMDEEGFPVCHSAAENAKLRELVRILVHCMDELDNCDSCPINGNPYDVSRDWAACDTLYEMLCELGVEVNG